VRKLLENVFKSYTFESEKMKIEYTPEFAVLMEKTIMVGGPKKESVIDLNITEEDYISDPRNAFAQEWNGSRYKYTVEELRSSWGCVVMAREQIMAWRLVKQGDAIALNSALEMVRA
jgi:hypothetical protein